MNILNPCGDNKIFSRMYMKKYLPGIKNGVFEEIIEIAQKNDVETVIIFGSRARGDYKERSDGIKWFYGF